MKNDIEVKKLLEKAFEIVSFLFSSDELRISRNELNQLIGDELEFYEDILIESITTINKIDKKKGRIGGIEFTPGKARRPEMSPDDRKK